MKKIDVSIIIVNHNNGEKVKSLIKSIYSKTNGISFEIILINNTSDDKNIKNVIQKYDDVKYIENKVIKGFSENNNIGIKNSNGNKIMLINPDIVLKNDAISILYKYMIDNPSTGICGGKLLNSDDTIQLSSRKFPSIKSTLIRRTPIRWFIPKNKRGIYHLKYDWDHNDTREVDWVLGACMLIDRNLICSIGMLDERFFLYCEDIDLCYRLKLLGYPTVYVSTAMMYHEHQGDSDKKFFSQKSFYHYKSMLFFLKKHKRFLSIE